ncbi:MAG TPA: ATP synthase F1 subunit delta [Chloroflexota bacterium]|jgi:F-type H+-transporting ATPase subunit delta|nr:ATP synthase F1 subunit delta [Chloroflexota bacterium]
MPPRSTVGKRYAEAIGGIARQDGSWDRWRRELAALLKAIEDRALFLTLESQRVGEGRKRELLDAALGEAVGREVRNLVLVLSKRGRLALLPDILSWFEELADRAQGVRHATVTTAVPLSEEQRAVLRRRLGGEDGQVVLTEAVDSAILGGLVVRRGDIIQDFSVRARLEALRERVN